MAKTIDYYAYWNKKRDKKVRLLDRELKTLYFISKVLKKESKVLDLGCGNGDFLLEIKKRQHGAFLKGLDYSMSEVKEARSRGLEVNFGDFGEGIEMDKSSFDIINASEIIEHLYNPDLMLSESNRVLKKGGYLILSTPNLCAWFNRILLPIGVQPLFLEPSTKSKLVGAGFLKKFKKESQPVGHVRIFTLQALKDMLEMNGFKIMKVKGAIYDSGFPSKLWFIDKLFCTIPTLSSHFVILAKKI